MQERGEIAQRLVVGQYGVGRRTQEVGVPDPDQGHHHGQVALERRSAEVLVHPLGTGEQLRVGVRTDGDHQCQTNRRPQRKTPADPVPKRKHGLLVDPEIDCTLGFGRQRGEMPGDRRGITQIGYQPVTRCLRIEHRFLSSKGLAGDQEKRRARIKSLQERRQLCAVEV